MNATESSGRIPLTQRARLRSAMACAIGAWAGLLWAMAALGQPVPPSVQPPPSVLAAPVISPADPAVEKRAFDAAARAFQDGLFERAEREFAGFVQKFPAAPLANEAILYQARAAIEQRKAKLAIELLATNLARAGPLGDQYRYWQAEAYLQGTNFPAAAETFALLIKEYTNSVRLLEAGYGEALARAKMREWPRVTALLQQPASAFQQASRGRANDKFVALGNLLLGEALLEQREFKAAEQVVGRLAETNLVPEFKYRRQYLLCRIQILDDRPQDALAGSTNLVLQAAASGQRQFVAEAVSLQAGVLHQLGRLDDAYRVYELNLQEGTPVEYSRQALVWLIRLTVRQNRIVDAAQLLQRFLAKHPADVESDLVLLTLGEMCLKLHVSGIETNKPFFPTNVVPALTNLPPVTNFLQAAQGQFDRLIATYTNSAVYGHAQLDRGWCFWIENRIAESAAAFRIAVERLPLSEDLAVARFKLGDAQFQSRDFTNALQNYRRLLTDFSAYPKVRNTLFDHACYQILRASLQVNDLAGALDAMSKILQGFPDSFYRDRGMLLVGQSLSDSARHAEARSLYQELETRAPNSPLMSEVQLAIARTFAEEEKWDDAIRSYDAWLQRYTNHTLLPTAEYNRAWASYQAGRETNALALFTNFVARFPTHELAPRAQFWVASFYYNEGKWVEAEKNFQDKTLLQNPAYAHPARMMAGRAAFARQSWKDARDYFTALVNDNTATNLQAEAFFALGDTITRQEADPAKPLDKFDEARLAFEKIPLNYPASPLVPAAWGRVGDCFLQLATADPKLYDSATNAYGKVAASQTANPGLRYQAEVGIGQALEKMAEGKSGADKTGLLKAAFDHYYNIVSEKRLRAGEKHDVFWFKEAGLHAARLAEDFRQWDVAIRLYTRLVETVPALRVPLEKRIEKARDQTRQAKN